MSASVLPENTADGPASSRRNSFVAFALDNLSESFTRRTSTTLPRGSFHEQMRGVSSITTRFLHGTHQVGYALALSFVTVLVLMFLSGLEWHQEFHQESSGLAPYVILKGILVPTIIAFSFANWARMSHFTTESDRGPRFAHWSLLATFVSGGLTCGTLASLDSKDSKYYGIDIVTSLSFGALGIMGESFLRKRSCDSRNHRCSIETHGLRFVAVSVVAIVYPLWLIPAFFGGSTITRFLVCVAFHPIVNTAIALLWRQSNTATRIALRHNTGRLTLREAEVSVFEHSLSNFYLTQIMAFYRRFMLLDLGSREETLAGVVLVSALQGAERAFSIEFDNWIHRLRGKPEMVKQRLRIQHIFWMSEANHSCVAELNAIFISFMSQIILEPNARTFALGYDAPDTTLDKGSLLVVLMLELTLAVLVEVIGSWTLVEQGVPVTGFFHEVRSLKVVAFHASVSAGTIVIALFAFIRTPSVFTCDSKEVCMCLSQPGLGEWFELSCAGPPEEHNISTAMHFNNSEIEGVGQFKNVNILNIALALISGLALIALIFSSSMFILYQKAERRARAKIKTMSFAADRQRRALRFAEDENFKLKKSLENAQRIVKQVTDEGGSILQYYKLNFNNIELQEPIGEGSFGTVYKAVLKRRADTIIVAVKTLRTTKITKASVRSFMDEIRIMAPLRHENLVRLWGGCWDEAHQLSLVLEYCSDGSLGDLLKRDSLRWSHARRLLLGVASCFKYLHHDIPGKALIHRDLKPENVLISNQGKEAKVADFGESKSPPRLSLGTIFANNSEENEKSSHLSSMSMSIVGTPLYLAPEIVNGNRYGCKVDVYAFGILLLEVVGVCGGSVSWSFIREQFTMAGLSRVADGWRPSPPNKLENTPIMSFIAELWSHNPFDRPTFPEIIEKLTGMEVSIEETDQGVSLRPRRLSAFNQKALRKAGKGGSGRKRRFSALARSAVTEETRKNREIGRYLKAEARKASDMITVLMLGTSNAGKSTIFKQLMILHSDAFQDVEARMPFAPLLQRGFIDMVQTIDSSCVCEPSMDQEFSTLREDFRAQLSTLNDDEGASPPQQLLKASLALWQRSEIVHEFEQCKDALSSNAQHLAHRSGTLCSSDYCPTIADVLYARKSTATVQSAELEVSLGDVVTTKMRVVDPAGQRSRRRKWLTLFDGVDTVLFVVSLAEYCEFPEDSQGKNGLRESIDVFKEIIATPALSKAAVSIFLNKNDIFRSKIATKSIGDYFKSAPQGEKGRDYERALKWIRSRFLRVAKEHKHRINIYVTTATDREQAEKVLFTLLDKRIHAALDGGFGR